MLQAYKSCHPEGEVPTLTILWYRSLGGGDLRERPKYSASKRSKSDVSQAQSSRPASCRDNETLSFPALLTALQLSEISSDLSGDPLRIFARLPGVPAPIYYGITLVTPVPLSAMLGIHSMCGDDNQILRLSLWRRISEPSVDSIQLLETLYIRVVFRVGDE